MALEAMTREALKDEALQVLDEFLKIMYVMEKNVLASDRKGKMKIVFQHVGELTSATIESATEGRNSCIKVIRKRDSPRELKSFIESVMRNVAVRACGKHRTSESRRKKFLASVENAFPRRESPHEITVDDIQLYRDVIPPDGVEIIEAYYIHGKPWKEIAAARGVSAPAMSTKKKQYLDTIEKAVEKKVSSTATAKVRIDAGIS